MKRINRAFPQLILLSLALPALMGLALTGTVRGALTGLLWGGFARIFVQHHVTWSVNSICHFFGTRRFAVEDQSTNVFWLALPSFGESGHHNHHAFPRSAATGCAGGSSTPPSSSSASCAASGSRGTSSSSRRLASSRS